MVEPAKTKLQKSATGLFGINTIYGANGDHDTPYLTRAWIGRLRIHIFYRGDNDPDCHDHPWDFWTFPLTSYVEEVAEPDMHGVAPLEALLLPPENYRLRRQVVRAFWPQYRPATHCHRVIGRYAGVKHHWSFLPTPYPAWMANRFAGLRGNALATDERKVITIVWRGKIGRKWGFLKNRDGKWCWTPWKEYVFGGGKSAPCEPAEGGDA